MLWIIGTLNEHMILIFSLQMQLRRQKRHQGEQAFVTDKTDDLDLED